LARELSPEIADFMMGLDVWYDQVADDLIGQRMEFESWAA
jgi:hypothetical protein